MLTIRSTRTLVVHSALGDHSQNYRGACASMPMLNTHPMSRTNQGSSVVVKVIRTGVDFHRDAVRVNTALGGERHLYNQRGEQLPERRPQHVNVVVAKR